MITDSTLLRPAADWLNNRRTGMSRAIASAVLASAALFCAIGADADAANAEPAFKKLPFAIACARGSKVGLGYLNEVEEDGSAIYMSMDGRRAIKLTAEGKTKKVMGMASGAECVGKTIDELRAEGLTVGFPK